MVGRICALAVAVFVLLGMTTGCGIMAPVPTQH